MCTLYSARKVVQVNHNVTSFWLMISLDIITNALDHAKEFLTLTQDN